MSRCAKSYEISSIGESDLSEQSIPVLTGGTSLEERLDEAGGKHYRAINPSYATVALINHTGYKIMQRLNGLLTIADIAQALSREHGVEPANTLADVKQFVALGLRQKMVYFRGEEPPEVLEVTSATGPQEVWLNITNACNLRCVHCFRESGKRFADEMSTEEIARVISSIKALKVGYVVISGGEPFLRPDIFEILEELKRNEITVLLITNGTLINEAEAKRLGEIRPWIIQVSLDGSTAEIHDRIRGAGTFDKTIAAIRLLVAENLDVRMYPTIHRWNIRDLINIKKLARSLRPNFDHFAFAQYHPTGRGKDYQDELDIPDEEFEQILGELLGEEVKNYNLASDEAEDLTSYLPTRTPYGARKTNCGLGYGVMSVDPDGKVYPCQWLHFPEFMLGDLHEKSLEDLYFSSPVVQRCRSIRVDHDIKGCVECEFKYFCGGGCRAKALTYSGDIRGKDPSCHQYLAGYTAGLWAQSVWATTPCKDLNNAAAGVDNQKGESCAQVSS
ncbi:MAG: PqqD family peptide modification chaperone [Acidobacteriota bacterium]